MKQTTLILVLMLFATALTSAQEPARLATQQSVGELYVKISGLNSPERRKFYSELDGKMKAKLWLLHITSFELDHQDSLTFEQVDFIRMLKDVLKGADMDVEAESNKVRLAIQQERAKAIFGLDGARRLLVELGARSKAITK